MPSLAWLTARPIAHRGLHDATAGVIENTASAFAAAIAGGYAIETDLQISADGEAFVHHDDALGRLTEGSGRLAAMTAGQIEAVRFKATRDRIMTLGDLCDFVAGRATLVIELKSHFDGDRRLVQRCAHVLANYHGPVAVMSFDPAMIEVVRWIAPHLTRGIVAERHYSHHEWDRFPRAEKRSMAMLLHATRTRPHFIAYAVNDLPAAAPLIARTIVRLPLLTWTVRSEADRRVAARWADQMIFEGIRP
jgi:glycerophosphoryl diester phosphodiesterase